MNLDADQIEILILESALGAATSHTQRCKRRMEAAQQEYYHAAQSEQALANHLQYARENYLKRTV